MNIKTGFNWFRSSEWILIYACNNTPWCIYVYLGEIKFCSVLCSEYMILLLLVNINTCAGLTMCNIMSGFTLYCSCYTVMRIIKLKIFPVPVQLHSGYGKLILSLFHHFLQYLRTLYIVLSLVRCWVTRRLTRLQTMCNVLKYRKIL